MLRELLRTWRVDALPAARRLGLVREHAGIAARQRRVQRAWEPHLARSRAFILAGAERCAQHRHAVIVGIGDGFDVPVEALARMFQRVTLADVVLSPAVRRWQRQIPDRIEGLLWDTTGALAPLASNLSATPEECLAAFRDASIPSPFAAPPDLVVSANCLSQLGLIPASRLPASQADESLPDRCATAAARRHLQWLGDQPGTRVLLADIARLELAPDGAEQSREDLLSTYALRPPDESWRWDLAPIPEWSPSCHRVHEVGAWLNPGSF